jgi:glycosyltransferase involved in cell wall biosynthesis
MDRRLGGSLRGEEDGEMTLPKISVVTPSFNQAHFLEETIQSVLSQGYPDLEYIVMDGGSTDGSKEIIRKFADRLADWKSAKDGGQAEAIRDGFARATGEILCWLNSDDTLASGTLKMVGEFFAAHPDVDLVYGDLNLVDAEGKRLYTARPLLRLGILVYENAFIPQQAMFWRRSLYERVGGLDPSLDFAMDFDLVIRFLLAGARVRKLQGILANYRWHPAAKSSTIRDVLEKEINELIFRHLPAAAAEPSWQRFLKKMYFRGMRYSLEPRSLASALMSRIRN